MIRSVGIAYYFHNNESVEMYELPIADNLELFLSNRTYQSIHWL